MPAPADRTPVGILARRGGLHPGTLLAHGIQVTPADIAPIAEAGAAVALCPRSNANLGVGRAPVELYRRAGVLSPWERTVGPVVIPFLSGMNSPSPAPGLPALAALSNG